MHEDQRLLGSCRHTDPQTSAGTTVKVLLALAGSEQPSYTSLQRTVALARDVDAEVHVFRVVPRQISWRKPWGEDAGIDDTPSLYDAQSITRTRLSALLGSDSPREHHHFGLGGFVEQVAQRAAALRAGFIVLPGDGQHGEVATELVRRSGAFVLIARRPAEGKPIVACTDLRDRRYPVLRSAAALGVRMKVPLFTLHNVPTVLHLTGLAGGRLAIPHLGEEAVATRSRRLQEATAQLGVHAEPVVLCEPDPIQAILEQARNLDADLIVAGTRPRSWLSRTFLRSTAADLANAACSSVLLAPLDPA